MTKTAYNTRTFLNPSTSPSTGSIICYDGETTFHNETERNMFVEIADCRNKVRIHKCLEDSPKQFLDKVKLMRDELNNFIKHLER